MNTNKYKNYSAEDFVWDEQFRNWVLSPDSNSTSFWNNWLQQHPEKESIVQQATEVIKSLTVTMDKLSEQKKKEIIARTLERLESDATPFAVLSTKPVLKMRYMRYSFAIAASALVAVACIWLIVNKTSTNKNTDYAYNKLVKQSSIALAETVNTSATPLLVVLSDSSKVTLDRGARISYAPSFSNTEKREVYLSGNAFFQITKNPMKPFMVHANGIITKVLGTSFKVQTDLASNGVTVEVVTGRVEVYKQPVSAAAKTENSKDDGVILTPNQKVVYSGGKNVFETSLVEEPVPIEKENKKIAKEDFVFEDAPLRTVIQAIEKIYGIKVEVENEAILNCPFTGDISEQNLHRKFDAICQTTKTTYEVKETTVFIRGQGCN
jgi:ferric-dicitrate binding protein FerR (iron transport regulator)